MTAAEVEELTDLQLSYQEAIMAGYMSTAQALKNMIFKKLRGTDPQYVPDDFWEVFQEEICDHEPANVGFPLNSPWCVKCNQDIEYADEIDQWVAV